MLQYSGIFGETNTKKSWFTIFISCINALFSWVIPNKIICCASSVKKQHVKRLFCERKMLVVFNGFEISDHELVIETRRTKQFIIGMAARWDPQKSHDILLKAVSFLRTHSELEVSVRLAGKGVDSKNLELVAESLELSRNEIVYQFDMKSFTGLWMYIV